jgi:hypothetical protein
MVHFILFIMKFVSPRKLKTEVMHSRKCEMHGKYLNYESYLNTMKNYTMIAITITMLVIALVLFYLNLSLGWLYSWMGIIVGPGKNNFLIINKFQQKLNFEIKNKKSRHTSDSDIVLGAHKQLLNVRESPVWRHSRTHQLDRHNCCHVSKI